MVFKYTMNWDTEDVFMNIFKLMFEYNSSDYIMQQKLMTKYFL